MLFRTIALSDHWFPRMLRRCRQFALNFSVPAPRVLVRPLVSIFLALRATYYFLVRVLVCEPFFKSYCTRYGKNLHTGVFLHWVQGRGELIVGDNVSIDGKCSFTFAARYSPRPTLTIGDNSGMGHNCMFRIGDRITIGRNVRLAGGVMILDLPGHPMDPVARREGKPAPPEDVKPVVIEDDVWIGRGAIIMPGTTIGHGSVVAAGSVVMAPVPANVLVAGNPARQVRTLTSSTSS
jgi:acetyltransferase-like isoleucine patch superfamily enzyme